MENKLFDIEPIEVERSFQIDHYKGNRVLLKIMRLMEKDGIYKVERTKKMDFFILRIKTKVDEYKALENLKFEIISYIADHFPKNYLFDFSGCPLGFIYSFWIRGTAGEIKVYHRIKEINKNSLMPVKQINI